VFQNENGEVVVRRFLVVSWRSDDFGDGGALQKCGECVLDGNIFLADVRRDPKVSIFELNKSCAFYQAQ
jgi:hypothetical protein